LVTKTGSGNMSSVVEYEYDLAPANGIGKLNMITGSTTLYNDFTYEYEYNADGRMAHKTETIGTEVFESFFTYDPLGRPTGEIYPEGYEVSMHYNAAGYLEEVYDETHSKRIWTCDAMNERMQITRFISGNDL